MFTEYQVVDVKRRRSDGTPWVYETLQICQNKKHARDFYKFYKDRFDLSIIRKTYDRLMGNVINETVIV